MTSSLVGSEMCIRDRVPMSATPVSTIDRSDTPISMWWRSFWRISGPVSYTHLTLPTICSV
eukprot:1798351-Prorocentrum_lima.AAC.1